MITQYYTLEMCELNEMRIERFKGSESEKALTEHLKKFFGLDHPATRNSTQPESAESTEIIPPDQQ